MDMGDIQKRLWIRNSTENKGQYKALSTFAVKYPTQLFRYFALVEWLLDLKLGVLIVNQWGLQEGV